MDILFVMQGTIEPEMGSFFAQKALESAEKHGIQTLDLRMGMRRAFDGNPALREQWFCKGGHMATAGNEWVAGQILMRLKALGWLKGDDIALPQ